MMPVPPDTDRRRSGSALWWREIVSRLQVRGAERRLRRSAAERACERIVSQTNPALRGMPGYRRRLRPVAERILAHADALLRAVPGPIALDPGAWTRDPLVNALFADPNQLRQVASGREVQRWLRDHPEHGDELYGLLVAMPQERHQLGMALIGDKVQRDVKQTTLGFAETEIVAVADSMHTLRGVLVQPVADLLVSIGQGRIAVREERIQGLEEALAMLRAKFGVVSPRRGGADLALGASSQHLAEQERLRREVEETEHDLADARRGLADIGQYLETVIQELEHPEREAHLETMDLWLDPMNVIRDRRCEGAHEIRLVRARRADRPGRVAQYVRFPRSLVLDQGERLDDIQRQIGG
jgi:hypothetical protein